jgi:signal transduction histidine kinase
MPGSNERARANGPDHADSRPSTEASLCESLAVASHELRGPLQAIAAAAALLESADADQGRHIAIVRRSSERALRLVTELLDGALIGTQRLEITRERTDLRRLIDQAWDAVEPAARVRTVQLETTVPELLAEVRGDVDRLIQVLTNLLDNAVRFTPAGGLVRLEVSRSTDGVQVSVIDSGSGIAEEDLSNIFEPFWQSPQAVRGAAGLGLAISKGIIAAHGGRIWASSVAGSGTAISFTLPSAEMSRFPSDE